MEEEKKSIPFLSHSVIIVAPFFAVNAIFKKLILLLRGVRGEDEQQELGEEDIGKKEEDSREELTPSSSLPVV